MYINLKAGSGTQYSVGLIVFDKDVYRNLTQLFILE